MAFFSFSCGGGGEWAGAVLEEMLARRISFTPTITVHVHR